MQTLPCKHDPQITSQVPATIELLENLHEWHPDVLQKHSILPLDYKSGLVFRSAVESIRGSFIASSTTQREGLVGDVLRNLMENGMLESYKHNGAKTRNDFDVVVSSDYCAALEVKGGEGNSINISERPIWAKEFGIWSHLDGAIVNQPTQGAHSIVNRITNDLVRRDKRVDMLFFKDALCGTRARPCPKYPGQETSVGLRTAPDIFLFPTQIPTDSLPKPSVHSLSTLRLPGLILDLFGIPSSEYTRHIWEVHVELIALSDGRHKRKIDVTHMGKIVDSSTSRAWK